MHPHSTICPCGNPIPKSSTPKKYCSGICYHTYSKIPVEDRLWQKVDKSDIEGCWPWTGSTTVGGYGCFWDGKKIGLAHRIAYIVQVGPIPEGLHIAHSCDNRLCCRGDHLHPATAAENNAEMKERGRNCSGDRHPFHIHPELLPHGENHFSAKYPELVPRGERHWNAIFTEDDIRTIRALFQDGFTQDEIAFRFHTSQGYISNIVLRKVWKHVV